MKVLLRVVVSLPAVAFVLAAAGCSSSATSPTSPSSASRGATIQGTVVTGAAASSASASSVHELSSGPAIKVTILGTSLSTMTDASGRFVLSGVPTGKVVVRFEGPGVDARLEISGLADGQTITITVQVQGTQAVLVQGEAEFTGTIQSITPPNMLLVSGQKVVATSATEIKRGDAKVPFSDLKVGDVVKVEGTVQSDGAVLAREIKAEGQMKGVEIEFKGMIDSITPPTLMVSGRKVVTDVTTKIKRDDTRLSLTDLKVGQTVEVEGTLQSDGSVFAREIEVKEEQKKVEKQEIEFKGVIQSITPPTLLAAGRKVVTNGSTEIRLKDKRGSLTDLKVGQKVEVEGTLQSDGSVLAEKIKVENDDND